MKIFRIIFIALIAITALIFLVPFLFQSDSKANFQVLQETCFSNMKEIVQDDVERNRYCNCLSDKLTTLNPKDFDEVFALYEENAYRFITQLDSIPKVSSLELEDCLNDVNLTFNFWTEELKAGFREQVRLEFEGSDFELTHDLNLYCDCMVAEYSDLPLDYIQSAAFEQSGKIDEIDAICRELSLIQ